MCTVSYYRDDEKVVITSNRDEHADRPMAASPERHVHRNVALYYPRDPRGGGSWFVVKSASAVYVLLNGAESKHTSAPPYRESRGIILLDIAAAKKTEEYWLNLDLLGIEPFTIIAYIDSQLLQLRWNGEQKSSLELEGSTPKIWSSATLYEPEIIKARETWFTELGHSRGGHLQSEDLWLFHTETERDDLENGLLINRKNKVFTKSVTQFVIKEDHFKLIHSDFKQGVTTEIYDS